MAHTPVLLDEVLAGLAVKAEGRYCDATFGRGGHAAAILGQLGPAGRLCAIDRDPEAIAAGRERFAAEPRLTLVRGSFGQLEERVRAAGWEGGLQGVLLDLGVSSPQLDEATRGFSFMQDGPLDMRMDNESGLNAAQWLARAGEREIADVLFKLGEEKFSRRIARAIVATRAATPIATTRQLADVVAGAVPTREPGKHPATRTFQAIRIHVNRELEEAAAALPQAVNLLAPGGRLCVISFHSLEDRLVKRFMRREAQGDPIFAELPQVPPHARPRLRLIGGAVMPGAAEIARNPRARSAVLRVAERIAA
ncbi:MAG: 16S rRNA (cytosine(1402)-N(4))-methyltransferase RsmH [Steroidobacteraceae bacterium]